LASPTRLLRVTEALDRAPAGTGHADLPRLPMTERKPAIYMEEVTVGRTPQPPGRETYASAGHASRRSCIRCHRTLISGEDSFAVSAGQRRFAMARRPVLPLTDLHQHSIGTHGSIFGRAIATGFGTALGSFITSRAAIFLRNKAIPSLVRHHRITLLGGYTVAIATSHSAHKHPGRRAARERTRIGGNCTILYYIASMDCCFASSGFEPAPTRPDEAKHDSIMHRSGGASDHEGRDAVHELRSSAALTQDLAVAMSALAKNLRQNRPARIPRPSCAGGRYTAKSGSYPSDEVYRMRPRRLRKCIQARQARRIEVEIRYGRNGSLA